VGQKKRILIDMHRVITSLSQLLISERKRHIITSASTLFLVGQTLGSDLTSAPQSLKILTHYYIYFNIMPRHCDRNN
jgi:hypothetical protein